MRYVTRILPLLLAVSVLPGCFGSGQANDATAAMKRGLAKMRECRELDGEITEILQQTRESPATDENVNEMIGLVGDALEKLDTQRELAEQARAEYAPISGYDVEPDVRLYAQMLEEGANMQLERTAATRRVAEDMRTVFNALADGKQRDKRALEAAERIPEEVRRLGEMDRAIIDQQARTTEFFEERKLGE